MPMYMCELGLEGETKGFGVEMRGWDWSVKRRDLERGNKGAKYITSSASISDLRCMKSCMFYSRRTQNEAENSSE